MTAPISFFLATDGKPGVKGNSKRIVFFGSRPSIKGKDADVARERTLEARLMAFRPAAPLAGPLRLTVTFVIPIPAGFPAWKRAAALARTFHPVSRPDRGNMLKLIEDAMAGPFYGDDAQIVDGPVRKAYGETPGYEILLEAIPQATKPAPLPRCARRGCKRRVDEATSHYCGEACNAHDAKGTKT